MTTGTCQHREDQQIWKTRRVLVSLIAKYSKYARDPLSSTRPLPSPHKVHSDVTPSILFSATR